MKVVGQTKFFIKIKTRKGYTSKKLLHCLVVDHSYDLEILISWDKCILFGIIPENLLYCFLDDDSDSTNEKVDCDKEEENPEKEESTKNRRQKEEENPELFKKVLDEAISRIESKENDGKNKKMAKEIRKST